MLHRLWLAVVLAPLLLACGDSILDVSDSSASKAPDSETLARVDPLHDAAFRMAGEEFSVPPALLKAFSFAQTRYQMVEGFDHHADGSDEEPAVTAWGLMALSPEQVAQGAALAGVSEAAVRTDPAANIRAAAALLSAYAQELALDRREPTAWAPALARLGGFASSPDERVLFIRDHVFKALRLGVGALSDGLAVAGQTLAFGASSEFGRVEQGLAAPDYPGGTWLASPFHDARSGTVRFVVIHTCEGSTASCISTLRNSPRKVSAHYVVGGGGEVTQLVREDRAARHIGASYLCSRNANRYCELNGKQSNAFTVGIEHGGFASQSTFPAGQLDGSARLLCDITRDQKIARDRFHIVGHGQLQPYNRSDPGPNWPWTDYLNRANAACAPACEVKGAILQKYNQVNGPAALGGCVVGEQATPDGAGAYNHFERGSIYWHPSTGAHVVKGAIKDKWAAMGWEMGRLGYPTSDEFALPDGQGYASHFQGGSIYFHPATGAWSIWGGIRDKYAAVGWEKSELGYPVTDEFGLPDGQGAANHFERGSIYWHPSTGAFAVQGAIREQWKAAGWERSELGYPLTDELPTQDGTGRYNHFQGGSIYWTEATGAHEVTGDHGRPLELEAAPRGEWDDVRRRQADQVGDARLLELGPERAGERVRARRRRVRDGAALEAGELAPSQRRLVGHGRAQRPRLRAERAVEGVDGESATGVVTLVPK